MVIEKDVNSNDKLVTKITLLRPNFLTFGGWDAGTAAGEEFLIQPRNSDLIQFVLVGVLQARFIQNSMVLLTSLLL